MSQLSEEESNFLRFYYLNLKIASKAVRVYFDSVHPPSGLAAELGKTSTSVTLKGLRFITKPQLQKLYPSTGSTVVRSEHFDTSLIVCLLRNMTPRESAPITGWDNLPQPGDTSTGADLARVKWYRNKLVHSEVGKLSPAGFTQYWGDLEGAIERLGGKTLLKEAQSAQHIVLDKSLTEMLNMVRICVNDVAEHAEKIDNLQLDIENQKTIKMEHENKIERLHDSLQQGEGEALKLAYELSDHKGTIDKCQEEIEACSKEIEKMGHMMEEIQVKALEGQNKVDELTQHLVGLACKHDTKMKEFDEQIAIQGTQMAKHDVQLAKHDVQLTKHDEQIIVHGEQVANFDGQLAKQGENIVMNGEQLALHVEQLANLDGQLAKHDEKMTTQVEQMAKHDTQMATCVKDIDSMKQKQFDTGVSSVEDIKRRLEDDTKYLIEEDIKEGTFVMTKAVTDGLLLLKQNGVLLITGHAGTGKSRISRHILHIVCSKNNAYKCLMLNTLEELENMIRREEHAMVLLDDIFGETNCIYNREKYVPILDKVHAYVCQGNIKVIITIRDTVKRQCQEVFENHRLFQFQFIDLSSNKYELDIFEKQKILNKYMKQVRQSNYIEKTGFVDYNGVVIVKESEVLEIILGNPVKGFPLAIYQFVHNEKYFQLGCKFFDRPTEAMLEEINEIRRKGEDERKFMIQYAILVYIAINANCINLDNSSNITELKNMIEAIYERTVKLKQNNISDTVKELKGSYLVNTSGQNHRIYSLHHQMLLESVVLSFAQVDEENKNKIIPLLSCSFVLKMVKPASYNEKEGDVVLRISTDSYKLLANRIVEIYMAKLRDVHSFVRYISNTEIFEQDGLLMLPYLLAAFEKEDSIDKHTENMMKSGSIYTLFVHLKNKQRFLTTLLDISADKSDTTFEMYTFILQELKQIIKTSNDFCAVYEIRSALISSLYDICSNKDVRFVKATLDIVEENKIPVLLDQGISLSKLGFSRFGLSDDFDCVRLDNTYIFLTFCIWKAYEVFNEPILEYLLSKFNEIQFNVPLFLEMIYTKDWIGTESSLSYKPLEWMVNRFADQYVVKSDFILKTACQCKLFDTVVYLASSKSFDAYSSLEIFLDDFELNRFSDLSELCRNKNLFNFLWSKVTSASTDLTPIVISILKKTRNHDIPEYVYNAILPVCLNKKSLLTLACKNAHFYLASLIIEKSHIIDIQSTLIAACMPVETRIEILFKSIFEESNVEINQLEIVENILLKFGCEQFDLKTACRQAYQFGNFKIIRWFVQNIDIVKLDLEIIIQTALVGEKIEILEYIVKEHIIANLDKMDLLKYITKYYTARYYVVILKTVSVIWKSAKDKRELKMEEIVTMAYEGKCFELLVWIHLSCKLHISIDAEKVFLLACQECRMDVAEWVLQNFDQTSLKIDGGNVFIKACEKICNKQEVTSQIIGTIDWTREVSQINPSDLKSGVLKLINHEGDVTWKIRDDFMDFKMNLVIDILKNNLIVLSTDDIEQIMNKSLEQKYYDLVNWLMVNKSSWSFDKQNILNKACADGEIKTLKMLKKEFHCLDIHEAISHACSNSWKSTRHCQYIHDQEYMYISYNDDQTIACLDLFLEEIHHDTIDISRIVSTVCEEEDISDNVMTWFLLNLPHEQIPINDVLIACCRLTKLNHVKYILHTVNSEQFDITDAFGWACSMLGEWETNVQLGLCVVDCLFQRFRDKICSLFIDLNVSIESSTCHLVLFFLEKGHCGSTNMKNLLTGAYINGHFKVVQWILAHVEHTELDIQSTVMSTCWKLHIRNIVKSYRNKHEDLRDWLSYISNINQRMIGLTASAMFNFEEGELKD
ncbi:uncharacterized protein [Mytilus edulis]|uniref:uncharacterized protein n=1 Tax=Mytilus edulis TaxID=6550 RepID=UPI0039F08B53